MGINYDTITFTSNTLSLRRFKVAIFADIVKIETMLIKEIFKASKQVKRTGNYVSICNVYLCFLIQQNLLIFGEKMLISAELKGYVM